MDLKSIKMIFPSLTRTLAQSLTLTCSLLADCHQINNTSPETDDTAAHRCYDEMLEVKRNSGVILMLMFNVDMFSLLSITQCSYHIWP